MDTGTDAVAAYFDRKKKAVIERLLGPETPYPIPDNVTVRFTSKITDKSCYADRQIGPDANPSAFDPWLRNYNEQRHDNNHKIVTYVDNIDTSEVPPPVK